MRISLHQSGCGEYYQGFCEDHEIDLCSNVLSQLGAKTEYIKLDVRITPAKGFTEVRLANTNGIPIGWGIRRIHGMPYFSTPDAIIRAILRKLFKRPLSIKETIYIKIINEPRIRK